MRKRSLRAEALPRRWTALVLGAVLLTTGCVTGILPSGGGGASRSHLLSTPRETALALPGLETRPARPSGREAGRWSTGWGSRGEVASAEHAAGRPLSCAGQTLPAGWPELSSSSERELFEPWLACATPADFIQLQQRVDMPRLVERLGEWKAVQLGALGPMREEAAAQVNHKRAAFLVHATEEYGAARAEVFALFILHSAYDDDVREMLGLLARDKLLGRTFGLMPTACEELARRGLRLSDTPERDFQWSDLARGAARAGADILDSSPAADGGKGFSLFQLREQLPLPYQQALDAVERAQTQGRLSPGNVALGVFDHLTFGVPLGFYSLVRGTGHGLSTLRQGEYEEALRELTPALLMVTLHVGGKVLRAPAEGRGVTESGAAGVERLEPPEGRWSVLKQQAWRLQEALGMEGVREVARELQASREAGRFVAVGGVDALLALHEARGDVARAQVWMSRARPEALGSSLPKGGEARAVGEGASERGVRAAEHAGGLAALVDTAEGLTRDVINSRLAEVEREAEGPRLSKDVKVLERQRPALEAPPAEARDNPRWREYVDYYEGRLEEVRKGMALEGPLRWEAYEQLRGWFARGLRFENAMVKRLRADAALPRAQRRFLGDFDKPRIERSVGVSKPGSRLRFADVLVIEEGESAGRTPRVETFSFKSRNLAPLTEEAMKAQITEDAREAIQKYGEALNIHRDSLQQLLPREGKVPVRRVRLIYEGGALAHPNVNLFQRAVDAATAIVRGVEVLVQ